VLYPVSSHRKSELLLHLLEREAMEPLLVFTKTKRGAEKLHSLLEERRFKAARIHSDRTQSQRQAALDGFKKSHYQILIATDVVARGIDVQDISHVVNFDLPNNADDYIHRIGRTARAEKSGLAYSFVSPEDEGTVLSIERHLRTKLNRVKIGTFENETSWQPKAPSSRSTADRDRFFRQTAKPASTQSGASPKVFDRFAHGFESHGRINSGNRTIPSRSTNGSRKNRGNSRNIHGNTEASGWVEGRIGAPTQEERSELRRLQLKIFGSAPQRGERRGSFRTDDQRNRY
jgi:ATP-dependent RNA helicase RhlE